MIQVESIHEKFGRELINKWYEVFGRMTGDPVTKNGDRDASPMEAVSLSVAAKTLLYGVHGEYNELVDEVKELKDENTHLKAVTQASILTAAENLNLQTVVENLNKELLRVKLQRDLAVKELEAQKERSKNIWEDQVVALGTFLYGYPSCPNKVERICDKAVRVIKDLQAQVDGFAPIRKTYNDNGDALLKLGAFLINYPSNDNETTTQKAARIVKEAECFCSKLEIANNGLRNVNEDLLQGVYGPNAEQLKKEVEELKKHCHPVLKLLTVTEIADVIYPWILGNEDVETAMRKLMKAQLQKDQRATGG
jgi:hypothetical protein